MVQNSESKNEDKRFIRLSFASGLVSGAINKFLTHPFDTLKARIQINQIIYSSVQNIHKSGIIDTGLGLYRTEGVRGFLRGVNIACVR